MQHVHKFSPVPAEERWNHGLALADCMHRRKHGKRNLLASVVAMLNGEDDETCTVGSAFM